MKIKVNPKILFSEGGFNKLLPFSVIVIMFLNISFFTKLVEFLQIRSLKWSEYNSLEL